MNIVNYNRSAWNRQSKAGSRWCQPVDSVVIQAARKGDWSVILTPNKAVPVPVLGERWGALAVDRSDGFRSDGTGSGPGKWWEILELNQRPLACHASALTN
jgi:hypothetical protein